MIHDGLWDIVNDFHMGISNELCSERYDVSREDQDRYAAESYRRALAAIADGRFKERDRTGIHPPAKRGSRTTLFDTTSAPGTRPYEALAKMKSPAFQKDGFGTAGNASIISDGAAAVVVMSREKAEALGCTVLASIGAQASYRHRHEVRPGGPHLGHPQMPGKGRYRNR
jgi:acetyl-CoA C-acetyltransferase